jgi:hypothetical protein
MPVTPVPLVSHALVNGATTRAELEKDVAARIAAARARGATIHIPARRSGLHDRGGAARLDRAPLYHHRRGRHTHDRMSPANAWPPSTPPRSRIFWTTKTRSRSLKPRTAISPRAYRRHNISNAAISCLLYCAGPPKSRCKRNGTRHKPRHRRLRRTQERPLRDGRNPAARACSEADVWLDPPPGTPWRADRGAEGRSGRYTRRSTATMCWSS